MEHKVYDSAELKLLDDDVGILAGYASTFGNVDSQNERVMPGAFKRHLASFLRDGFVAVGHDWAALPIATPIDAQEDDRGLYVKAAFHSTPEAQAARTVMRERIARGKSVRLSIGYEVRDAAANQGVRELRELELFEWSYVTVPANPLTAVTYAKRMPLAAQSDAVLAAVEELTGRFQSLSDLRAKEGRVLSGENRKRIQAALEVLQMLLAEAEPKPKAVDRREEIQDILAKYEVPLL